MKMPGDVRWTVLVMLFLGGMINYLDRAAIAVAAPFLAKQLSLSPSELGWANAGTPLGGAIAGPVVGFIALAYGWRVSFIVIALIGLCWAVAWMLLVTDRPEQNVRVSAAERAAIAADPEVPAAGPNVSLG